MIRTTHRLGSATAVALVASLLFFSSHSSLAAPVPFSTVESGQYLIVALERINGNTDVTTNNFELGANKAPVPANTSFVNNNGGPQLEGSVPDLPSNAHPVFQGIGGHGNIAVTDPAGDFEFQDVGIYADPGIGIRVAAANDSFNKSSNTFFNDPNMFPNTFDVNTQTGVDVNPNDADQTTRVDPTGQGNPSANVGITFGFDHSDLMTELAAARATINGLGSSGNLDVSGGNAGELQTSSTTSVPGASLTFAPGLNSAGGIDATLTVPSGLSVIDIVTGSNDFSITNSNFVVTGPSDASVIFRLAAGDAMLLSQSNVLLGDGGIGLNNVLFYTDSQEVETHFGFNNSIINGVAFWSLGDNGGEININNAQGSTQLIADIVDLDDVRFTRWSFSPVPEPTSLSLVILSALALTGRRRR